MDWKLNMKAQNYCLLENLNKIINEKYEKDQTILETKADMTTRLETAMEGRNSVQHVKLTEIVKNWIEFLDSWECVCLAIGDNEAEIRIKMNSIRFKRNGKYIIK